MSGVIIAAVLSLALLGAPLFAIVGVATALCLALFTDLSKFEDLRVLVQHMENLATKQEFLAIPLFTASGAIMAQGGIARRLVAFMSALLCWLPGGMAVAAVAACMFFAAVSGSSPVTLIAVGSMMVPALVERRYPEKFSIGLVTTAGSLGCLVPPSIAMLIYSIAVSGSSAVDPSDLFLAGLVPAVLIASMLAVYCIVGGIRLGIEREAFSWAQLGLKAREASWAILLPVLILGGIYGGWYTPSQAGAVALIYSLFLTVGVYREMDGKAVMKSLMEAGELMGALLPIIVLAFGLNEFLALMDVQERLAAWVAQAGLSAAQFMLLVNVILIVLGALMDSISATLIFAPLLAPIAQSLYGIDPIHFGIVFVVNMEIGYLMPPVATNLFVAAAVFKKPFSMVTRAVLPTLAITCAALVIVIFLPILSLGLVHLKQGKSMSVSFPWTRPEAQAPATGTPETKKPPTLKGLTGKMLEEMNKDSGD